MLTFLLTVCDGGDQDKIARIYEQYHENMLKYAQRCLIRFRVTDPKNKAEDIVQSAFLKIVRSAKRIDFNKGEPAVKAYVFAIVHNEILNFIKKDRETVMLTDCEDLPTEDEFFAQLPIKEDYNRVLQAIKNLPEIYRYTLSFRYVQEMSVEEIAKTMGVSEKTVYTRLARGKQQLQELLRKEGIFNV